ncbi:MAG: RecB family exonuclease [Thermoplasmata archaeon]
MIEYDKSIGLDYLKSLSSLPRNNVYSIPLPAGWDISHLSYSSLDMYSQCMFKGVAMSLKVVVQEETPEIIFGKAFHRLAELVGKGTSIPIAIDDVVREFQLTPDQIKALESAWQGWYNPEKFKNIIATEYKFSITIAGREVIGFIDAVRKEGDTVILIDYKTGGYYSIDKAKTHLQLDLYALAWFKANDNISKIVTVYDFIFGGTVVKEYDRTDMDKLEKSIGSIIDRIDKMKASGVAEAKPGEACLFCPIKEYCPAFLDYIKRSPEAPLLNMTTEELEDELENIRTQITLLSNRADAVAKILKMRVDLSKYSIVSSKRYGDLLIPFDQLITKISEDGRKILMDNVKIPSSVLSLLPDQDRDTVKAFIEESVVTTLKKVD